MNLFQLASRGIDLDALPDESAPEREPLAFEPSPAGSRFAVPQEFDAAFQAAGDEYGVDPDVLRAMAFAESRFRPDVISGQVKSRTGAAGLMQFMPGTAERFGINPLDPVESIFGAAAYMRANLEKFDGDYGKAVAAYNWGENRKAYGSEDWKDRLPAETRGYLDTVFGAADELKLRAPVPASDAGTAVALPSGVAASTAGAGRGSVSPGMVNTKIPRAAVPDMTFGGVAQDVASGLLQVGPTAVKGVGEVIRLATGDRLGKGVTDFAERGIQATQDMVGSERAAAQRKNFAADMADDSVGLGTALANNKGALADQILPTIGSMFIPVGAAGAAGKLATVGKAARGLNTAALAARVASVQQAAGIGATAAQNAASTFAEMLDKGVPMQEAYTAAGITVPFSLIAGKLTGGGAEGALIKGLSGQNIARGVGEVGKGLLREGAQEGGESLGQVTGEVLGANQDVSLQSGVKRVGTEALLGAVMGGGMNAAQQMVPTVESQPTTPTAPVVPQVHPSPAPPTNRTAAEAADVASQILQAEQSINPTVLAAELDALRARSAPDFTQQSATPTALPGSVPVIGGLAAELQALRARSSPQEVANASQLSPSVAQQQTQAPGAQAADVAGVNAPVPAADLSGAGVAATQATGVDISTTQGVPANVPQPAQPGTQASQTPITQGTTTGARVVLQNRDRSTPSSIAQMRSIAARPDYGRLGFSRDFANGAPVVAGGTIQPAQLGRKDVATASDGRRIPVQYAVVDAGSVLTSNAVDGTSNPSYGDSNIPAVRAIAGNGRIAGLQSAYQSGNANAYRQELVQDASLHGIAPEVIAPMAQPVLVRVMPAEAVTADIGDISNTVGNLDLSAVEQASNDANRVTLDALQFAEDGSITPEVVRQFVRAMPQAEQGQLLDTNGQPTRQAVDRLSAAVFAKAYGNEGLTRLYSQAQDPEARLVMSALAQVAPKMARLEGAGALDVRDVVAQAAEIAVNARRQGIAIAKAAQQMDMAADPDVGVVLDLFASNARTVRPVVEALGRMADMAYTEASKPAEGMFGAVPRASRADIINQLRPENERGSQEALEDAAVRESAAVDAVGQANEPAGSATSATTEAGRPAEDAAPEGLNSYTPEEVAQRQAEAAQAEATAKRAEDAAARAEAAARQAKEIAQRSAAAADTFELGQSGEDSLSGQGGLMFSFAGARAATADTHALATAQDRLAAGENPETVRRETGWHRGADGRMRFEISDKDASMKIGRKATPLKSFARDLVRELDRPLRLSDVLDHPALFAAYPAVADYGVTFVPTEAMPDQARGTYSDGRIMLADDMPAHEALSTLLHEIQHGIQNIEGFATGDSVDRLAKTMPDEKAMNDAKLLARFMAKGESAFDARQRFMRYMGRDPNPQGAYLAERYEPGEIARMAATPLDAYQRSAGEVEARNTQARRGMTDAERRATPPSQTADVADSDVIVVFNGKEMQNAPSPANAEQSQTAAKQQPSTPVATIRNAIAKAYGNLLQRLESKGLVSLTQTDEDAIAAAAQARADKNGGDVEVIKASLRKSVLASLSPMKSVDANVRRGLNGIEATLVKSSGSNAWLLSGWEVKNPDELSAANVATEPTLVEPTTSRFNKGAGFADIMGFNGLDVKRSADGNLEGFFDPETGKSYLIADNLTAESAPGTLMHEVGIHMAADGKLQPLFDRAAQLLKVGRGNAFIQRVQARMDRSGETSGEEAAAYIVTEYENDRANSPPSVAKWVQDFTAAVRAWLFGKGVLLKADQLTVADIAAVARANARSMARGAGWLNYAQKDGAFKFGNTDGQRSKDIAEVADAFSGDGIELEGFSEFDGAQVGVRLKDAPSYVMQFKVQPGNGPLVIDALRANGDTGQSPGGNAGQRMYQTLFAWAHNNGRQVDADYSLSYPNQLRRTSAMLSSALRFGTIDHLGAVGEEQGVAGWNPDSYADSIEALAQAELEKVNERIPVFKFLEIDPATGDVYSRGGTVLEPEGQRLGDGAPVDGRIGANESGGIGAGNLAELEMRLAAGKKNPRRFDGREQDVVGTPARDADAVGNGAAIQGNRLSDSELARYLASTRGGFEAHGVGVSTLKRALITRDHAGTDVPGLLYSKAGNNPPPIPTNAQAGLFAPSNPWELPQATRTDRLIYELQDGRIDLKRVQEAIAATGKQITEGFDARLAETLMPGRIARRTESFLSAEVKPLLESMAKNNVSQDELSDYLLARHAPERNAQIAKVNDEMPDGGAGTNSQGVLMTTQAARDHIAALTQGKRLVLELLAKRVDDLTLGTREVLVREGLEKQETVDAWTGAYKHYVPLFKDEAMETPGHPIGAGVSVTGTASRRATGSTGEVTNMLAHILMQREAAITRAEKNRVAMSLYGLALTNPNAEMWTTIRPSMPSDQIANELVRMGVDPMEAEVGMQGVPTIRGVDPVSGKVVDRPNPMYKRLDNSLVVKVNGEDRVILFNASNERAVRLVRNLKNQDGVLGQLDLAGSIVGKATRYFASINTQYNPAFGMVNIVRDVGGAMVNLTDTALAGKQARVLSDSIPAMIGIARDLRGDAQRTPWSDLWTQFQDDGGRTGYRDLFIDPYKRADAVQSELDKLGKDGKLTPGAAAHAVLDLLDDFNTTLENGVRLAAYKAALDKGLSRAESARLARELTLDFNRKGRAGREMGPLFAFFNASVQGTARTLKALQGPAGKRILVGGLSLGVIQALLLSMAGYEDDEIPEFVKARAFIIPLAGKQYITIPLQFGLNALPNTGRVVTELLMSGGKDWGEKSFNALGELAGSFNPLGGGNIFTGAGALKTISPTVIDPIVDMATNTDFTGKPIGKERMPLDTLPGFAMARESTKRSATGQVYIGISKAINSVTGGNDFKHGLASPSPEEVRYVFTTVGGGVYRELEKILNASVLTAQGEDLKAREVPLGSRFAGEVDDNDLQRSRFFKNSSKIEKLEAQLKGLSKEGRGDEVRKLIDDSPLVKLYELNDEVRSNVTKLNKLASESINDKEALKRIDAARTTYMRALNDKVLEMEKAGR